MMLIFSMILHDDTKQDRTQFTALQITDIENRKNCLTSEDIESKKRSRDMQQTLNLLLLHQSGAPEWRG